MPGGRPTKMTPETVRILEDAFLMGCTDQEACVAADIVPSTLYLYGSENPEFSERKETLKQNPTYRAKKIILQVLESGADDEDLSPSEQALLVAKKVEVANKVIDRKEGTKVAVTGADGGPIRHSWSVIPVTSNA
jgi:hypothetical protein